MAKDITLAQLAGGCLVYTQLPTHHHQNSQSNLHFGDMAFLTRTKVYFAQLQSLSCLRKDIDSDTQFFDQLPGLISDAEMGQEEEGEDQRTVSINQKGVAILTVTLRYQVGKNPQNYLFSIYKESIKLNTNTLNILKIQSEAEQNLHQQNIVLLEQEQIKAQKQRDLLLNKLSGLYRSKTNKYRQLKEDSNSQTFSTQRSEDSAEKKNFGKEANSQPIIEEDIDLSIGATLFIQSQHFR